MASDLILGEGRGGAKNVCVVKAAEFEDTV